MLSSLPKLADKAFILGFVLPVLMFTLAALALFLDLPQVQAWATAAMERDALEKVVYLVLGIWAFAVFMLIINDILYKVLEGYLWPFSHCRRLSRREKLRYERMRTEWNSLKAELHEQGDSFTESHRLKKLWREFAMSFPPEDILLPTRFGNAIKAFESYANTVYGADSVTLWPHLSTVISKEFHAALDDSRAKVDFLVNLCFFGVLIGLIAAGRLAWNLTHAIGLSPFHVDIPSLLVPTNLYLMLAIVLATVVVRLSYILSIGQIHAWGNLVKAAFDSYLPALAEKLGYPLPSTADVRKKFWIEISQQITYHRPLKPEDWSVAGNEERAKSGQKCTPAPSDPVPKSPRSARDEAPKYDPAEAESAETGLKPK